MNYKFRVHDPRIGRFFAVDPLTSKYPHYTPYSFSGNKVIHAIELEGLEEWVINKPDGSTGTTNGPFANQKDAQMQYDESIDPSSVVPQDNFEKQILNGHFLYAENYGWVDRGHAFGETSSDRKDIGVNNLWSEVSQDFPTSTSSLFSSGRFTIKYTMDMGKRGVLTLGPTQEFSIKSGLSLDDKKSVALAIFQDMSVGFERFQGMIPPSRHSSFEPSDLPSNMLNFYMNVNGLNEDQIMSLIKPVSPISALMVYRQYPGTFSSLAYKNYTFKPVFFESVYTPVPYAIPKEFEQITPVEIGGPFCSDCKVRTIFTVD